MKVPLILLLSASTALLLGANPPSHPEPTVTAGRDVSSRCSLREEARFEGVASCKKCHFKQWMSWKKTPMSKAFETLKPGGKADAKKKLELDAGKDYTKDPKCLECHTTGYGKPGGYPALVEGKKWTEKETKRAAAMQGVQCESCHGPGSLTSPYKKENERYARAELVKRGLVVPDQKNCQACHNEKSPTLTKENKLDYDKVINDPEKIHAHLKLKYEH